MDKTYRDEFRRLFLIEHLPEPLTRADAHWQLFDNYLETTRLRLRSVRVPETKEWSWILQQRIAADDETGARWKIAEIYLDENEYHLFEQFEGREIRKNRYFYNGHEKPIEIDVYLGNLWGLNLARVVFDSMEDLRGYEFPLPGLEVTNRDFFEGAQLVEKNFSDVQDEVAEMLGSDQTTTVKEQ